MAAGAAPAAIALLVLGSGVAGWLLAPRIASLAGRARDRWWLSRWAQALAVAATTTLVVLTSPAGLWPGLALGLGAATLACLVDAAAHRLPDLLTLRWGGAALVLTAAGLLLGQGWRPLLTLVMGAALAGGVLGLLALAYPPGMGLGDVKLAGLLGGLVGAVTGWPGDGAAAGAPGAGALAATVLLVVAFILGGLVSLALLLARRVGRRDAVPFGPFLLLGALVVLAS